MLIEQPQAARRASGDARVGLEPEQLAEQRLGRVVPGVRLAGEDDLDRPLGVVEDPAQTGRIAQDQGRSLK